MLLQLKRQADGLSFRFDSCGFVKHDAFCYANSNSLFADENDKTINQTNFENYKHSVKLV